MIKISHRGNLNGPLKSQILKLTKSNVIYLGEIDDTSINYLKYKAFCYIFPSCPAFWSSTLSLNGCFKFFWYEIAKDWIISAALSPM